MSTVLETEFNSKTNILKYNSYLETIQISLEDLIFLIFQNNTGDLPFQSLNSLGDGYKYNLILSNIPKRHHKQYNKIVFQEEVVNLDNLCQGNELLYNGVTYIGKKRLSKNAREVYALILDIDNVSENNLYNLLELSKNKQIPQFNCIINSGSGVHLIYLLDEIVDCKGKKQEVLHKITKALYDIIWQSGITTSCSNKQKNYLSPNQGFRVVGGLTKFGATVTGFQIEKAKKWSLDNLVDLVNSNSRTLDKNKVSRDELIYLKSDSTIMYSSNVNRKFFQNEIMYKKWKERLYSKTPIIGFRYNWMLSLVITADKCGIDYNTLRKDLEELWLWLIDKTTKASLDKRCIDDSLRGYGNFINCTTRRLEDLVGFEIPRQKRNGRTQEEHLELLRQSNTGKKYKKGIKREYKGRNNKVNKNNKTILINSTNEKYIDKAKKTGYCRQTISKYTDFRTKFYKNKKGRFIVLYIEGLKFFKENNRIPTIKELQKIFYNRTKISVSMGSISTVRKILVRLWGIFDNKKNIILQPDGYKMSNTRILISQYFKLAKMEINYIQMHSSFF